MPEDGTFVVRDLRESELEFIVGARQVYRQEAILNTAQLKLFLKTNPIEIHLDFLKTIKKGDSYELQRRGSVRLDDKLLLKKEHSVYKNFRTQNGEGVIVFGNLVEKGEIDGRKAHVIVKDKALYESPYTDNGIFALNFLEDRSISGVRERDFTDSLGNDVKTWGHQFALYTVALSDPKNSEQSALYLILRDFSLPRPTNPSSINIEKKFERNAKGQPVQLYELAKIYSGQILADCEGDKEKAKRKFLASFRHIAEQFNKPLSDIKLLSMFAISDMMIANLSNLEEKPAFIGIGGTHDPYGLSDKDKENRGSVDESLKELGAIYRTSYIIPRIIKKQKGG